MSNIKAVEIVAELPYEAREKEEYGKLAEMVGGFILNPLFGLKVEVAEKSSFTQYLGGVLATEPRSEERTRILDSKHDGTVILTIKGNEAVGWKGLENLVKQIRDVGGITTTAWAQDVEDVPSTPVML